MGVTIDRSANKMYTHALLVLAMELAAECAPERAYGYGHHETTTTTMTTMKPEPYKKHDKTFYHRPSYKTYNGYNSYHHMEPKSYYHMEPRMYSPYHSYQTYASPVPAGTFTVAGTALALGR